jgi:hypothetical protein
VTKNLVEIIANLALFLEFSDESVLDLDAAVKQQEELAFRLQQLSPSERLEFIRLLNEVADESPFEEQKNYLKELPTMVGIA